MNILLKSVTIIDENNKDVHLKKRDILIKDGIIAKIAVKIEATAKEEIISYKNLHVSQGWMDTSVSFGEPGYEERETIENGLRVAGQSGFTDIILNPNTNPVPDSSSHIVFLKNAAKASATALHPIGCLSVKSQGKDLAELYDMKNAGAVAFSDNKNATDNSNLVKISLLYTQNFNGLVYSYPLDKGIAGKGLVNEGEVSTKLGLKGIPALAEELQIVRDLHILEYTGGTLHIPTISTEQSVKLIADAKKKGLNVSCSVAIHNLWFTDEVLESFETNYKVKPPLRTKKDVKALIKAVNSGTIDFVTTDHTPIAIEQKQIEFDNAEFGTIGLENAFGILNQIFGLEKTVSLLTQNKERYGITIPKIAEGEKACLSLFDPSIASTFKKEDIISTSKNSMFIGAKLIGKAIGIISNNKLIN